MQIALFIFYFALSCIFFYYYQFQKNTGLSIQIILILFLIKVIGGVVNLYIHFYSIVNNDIGFFHWQAINELKAMPQNPSSFFKDWLLNWGNFSDGFNPNSPNFIPHWKDIGVLLHTKYMTFANILSLGNQYVNVIIYEVPFFIGQLLLYKFFYQKFPYKKWLFVLVVFLIPSVVFWCSGIHKDGWVLCAFGIIFYHLNMYLQSKEKRHILYFSLGLLLLFTVRFFYFFSLMPLIILWIFIQHKKNKLIYISLAFICSLLLFFNLQRMNPLLNPMNFVQKRQLEFLNNKGYSDMQTPILENNFQSYISNFPTALNHIFIQPIYNTNAPLKYKITFVDNIIILSLFLFFAFHLKRKNIREVEYFIVLLYALSMYIFIGYTIPNAGALVRYKSEFTILLLASLVALSEVKWLNKI